MLVEACVESVPSALSAEVGGAGRVELCANLVEGGTTPSAGAIGMACERLRIPVMVMIRPRGGDFCYTDVELEVMERDVAVAKRLGAFGVVFGVLLPDGRIDHPRTRRLVEAARPLSVTFHRAFDVCRDPHEALAALGDIGVDRVLTSGQRATVAEGLPLIRELVAAAPHGLGVMPGGGVDLGSAAAAAAVPGVTELHVYAARSYDSPMRHRNDAVPMGRAYTPAEYVRTETDGAAMRAIVDAARARTP